MSAIRSSLRRTLTVLIATTTLAASVIAAAAHGSQAATVRTASAAHAAAMPTVNVAHTQRAFAFEEAMRALWEQHATYTEEAIVDAVGGLPNTDAVVATLLQNQVDLGNAVKPYYGAEAGDELTTLLKAHINDAVATVVAAKSGNATATKQAEAKFYANGNQVASFLHGANPRYWPLAAMKTMMRIHLDQVIGLAVDQIKGHYTAANSLYAVYVHHILVGMADMLSTGIIEQFPADFR